MRFLVQLREQLKPRDSRVQGVWIGPYWTGVQTETAFGLAATVLADGPTHGEHAQHLAAAGTLVGRSAFELAGWAEAKFALARSVGLAALNAMLLEPTGQVSERSAGDLLSEKGAGRVVGIVGWFPFIPQIQKVAARVEIFEKDPVTGWFLTAERAKRLAACEVLCVTASTLLNQTLDELLGAARPEAWKMLVGPSAPLCREVLRLGLDAVCGARVSQVAPVVRVIQEGGCFQQIRRTGAVRLLCLEADFSCKQEG